MRLADDAKDDSIRVRAYRGRPLFTFVEDEKPGQVGAYGFERITGSYRWIPFGPLSEMNLKTQL